MKDRKYKTLFQTFVSNGVLKEMQSSISFVNTATGTGGTDVNINGVTLPPGATLDISDETGALDVTVYEIKFAPGTYNQLLVIRKIYI